MRRCRRADVEAAQSGEFDLHPATRTPPPFVQANCPASSNAWSRLADQNGRLASGDLRHYSRGRSDEHDSSRRIHRLSKLHLHVGKAELNLRREINFLPLRDETRRSAGQRGLVNRGLAHFRCLRTYWYSLHYTA